MKAKSLKSLVFSILALGTIGVGLTTQANAAEWTARTVEQVRADINGKNEYTIVWGDTLGVISIATNIKQETLQSWNNIENADLIIAGNKLFFNGNVVTVIDNAGNVISENKVTDADKNNVNKPVGFDKNTKPVVGNKEEENNNNNNGGSAVTPPETEKPGNGNGGGEVTPPVTEQPGNGNGEGEVTPPETEEPGNGNGGGEVTPPETEEPGNGNGSGQVTPPTIVSGKIGNGGLFDTYEACVDAAIAQREEHQINGGGAGRIIYYDVVYSDGTTKFSYDFIVE